MWENNSKMNCEAKVSVIIGILARDEKLQYVKRALKSIQNQSYHNLEILISFDGSDPSIKEFCVLLCSIDERFFVLPEKGKINLAEKLNYCLEYATGTYVARMDDDDYSHPHRIETQVAYLSKKEEISFVGSFIHMIEGNKFCGVKYFPEKPLVKDFYITQPFIHPTLLFRTEVLKEIGGYSESKYCILCEDYDLLLRLYQVGYVGENLQEVLLDYTISQNKRKFKHRLNEVCVRFQRFQKLDCLHVAFPFIVKPVLVAVLPKTILKKLHFRSRS